MISGIIQNNKSSLLTVKVSQSALENSNFINTDDKVVRIIRGGKCRTIQEMYDEFAAALQFPYYFGENWAAFNDCMRDTKDRHPNLIIVIRNTRFLLDQNEQGKMLFFDVLQSQIKRIPSGNGSFQIILQETGASMIELEHWLTENEISFDSIDL